MTISSKKLQNYHIQHKNKITISSTKTKLPYPAQKQNDNIQQKNKMTISSTKLQNDHIQHKITK